MAKKLGFSIDELNQLSIGEVLDQVAEYVNMHSDKKETEQRKATQADFDNF